MDHILYLLVHYKYWLLFPLAIVEGPILGIIAGFLCSRALLNPFITLSVIVSGDVIGDSAAFALGSIGVPKFVRKIIEWLGVSQRQIEKAKFFLNKHPNSVIPLSKITLGIGVLGIYFIGRSGFSYVRFLRIAIVTSFFQFIFYLCLGWLFGEAYNQINHYLNYYASLCILFLVAVLLFFYLQSYIKKL
jgi:membrane-associated protein